VGDFNAAAKDVAAIATAKGFVVHHGHAGNQDSLVDNILLWKGFGCAFWLFSCIIA